MENGTITFETLQKTPSLADGYSDQLERKIRILCCRFIQSAVIILKLPQLTAATAQTLLQRYFFMESIGKLPLFDLIGGCLYLASKLEESPRRIRDILTTLDYLRKKSEGKPETPLDISHSTYFQYREGLLIAEINILAKLSFNVHVEHPHGFMCHYLSSLGLTAHESVAQLALNYLNDSYLSTVHVLYQPQIIAVAVVYLATKFANVPLPKSPEWYVVFDANINDIGLICDLILELYLIKIDKIIPTKIARDLVRE